MIVNPEDTQFSCVVIWQRNSEKGGYDFLVQDVVSHKEGRPSKKQTKFPGGNNRPDCTPPETPELTAQREGLEETGLTIPSEALHKIWEHEAPSDPDKPGKHTKYAFMAAFADCQGALRTVELRDNNDVMSPPQWMHESDLKFKLFNGHQPPFIKALERLSY